MAGKIGMTRDNLPLEDVARLLYEGVSRVACGGSVLVLTRGVVILGWARGRVYQDGDHPLLPHYLLLF